MFFKIIIINPFTRLFSYILLKKFFSQPSNKTDF